ncbi:MAG: 3-oxoacyl-ACP reductase FabG, partial [Bacteroidales bacterium]
KSLEKEVAEMGMKCTGFASDASKLDETQDVINKILAEFGQIDILVNNAGITKDTLLMRMTEEQWDAVILVNLKSVFNFTKCVQPAMLKQRGGSIINLSSVVGVNGNAGQGNYAASKAGIIGFTKSVAKEVGSRGIRCNAIAPGFILTEMTEKLPEAVRNQWIQTIPLKRGGTPEDVANTALFLASDLSSYVSGQVIHVCGAMST